MSRLHRADAFLVVIDLQQKLMPVIHDRETIERNIERLVRGSKVVDIPAILTEQYVQGLGQTVPTIRRAFEEFGFLYLQNHGVPQTVVDEMFAQSRAFFSLPAEVKRAAAWVGKTSDRGYTAPANVGLDATKPLDLRETFKAGSDEFGPTISIRPCGLIRFPPGKTR